MNGHYKYVIHNGRRYFVVGKDGLIWVPEKVNMIKTGRDVSDVLVGFAVGFAIAGIGTIVFLAYMWQR
jgi:hypothetical protein